jgi:hypothetical protein
MSWDRVRSSTDHEIINVSWTLGGSESDNEEHFISSIDRMSRYSRIKDSLSHALIDGHYRQKPVQHYHVRQRSLTDPVEWERAWSPAHRICTWDAPERFTPFRPDQLACFWFDPSLPGDLVRDFSREALQTFTTQIPQEMNLFNFLWELRELADLAPKVVEGLQSGLSTGAGSFLNWEFGWAPFLQDMMTFTRISKKVNDRLDYLRRTRKKVTRLGHRKTFKNLEDIQVLSYDEGFPGWNGVIHRFKDYQLTMTCGAKFTHDLPWLDTVDGKIRAFASALGLNNPLGALWEAMPFSFLIDWVVPVGDMLNGLAFQDESAYWRIWDVNHSFRYTWVDSLYQESSYYEGPLYNSLHTADQMHTWYTRDSGFPEVGFLETLDPSELSTKQIALLAALVLAN